MRWLKVGRAGERGWSGGLVVVRGMWWDGVCRVGFNFF